MPCPFHNHLRGDAEAQGVDHEGAPCAVGCQQLPFGVYLLPAVAPGVVDYADGGVDADGLSNVLQRLVHLLVGDDRQGLPVVAVLLEVGVFGEDGPREVVEFDAEAVGGLLRHDADVPVFDVGGAQGIDIRVTEAGEAAEAEDIPHGGLALGWEVVVVQIHQFLPFKVYYLLAVAVGAFEFGAEGLEGVVVCVAMAVCPAEEPAEDVKVFGDGDVSEALFEEVAHEHLQSVFGEVCEGQFRGEGLEVLFDGLELGECAGSPSVLMAHGVGEDVDAVKDVGAALVGHGAEVFAEFRFQFRW